MGSSAPKGVHVFQVMSKSRVLCTEATNFYVIVDGIDSSGMIDGKLTDISGVFRVAGTEVLYDCQRRVKNRISFCGPSNLPIKPSESGVINEQNHRFGQWTTAGTEFLLQWIDPITKKRPVAGQQARTDSQAGRERGGSSRRQTQQPYADRRRDDLV